MVRSLLKQSSNNLEIVGQQSMSCFMLGFLAIFASQQLKMLSLPTGLWNAIQWGSSTEPDAASTEATQPTSSTNATAGDANDDDDDNDPQIDTIVQMAMEMDINELGDDDGENSEDSIRDMVDGAMFHRRHTQRRSRQMRMKNDVSITTIRPSVAVQHARTSHISRNTQLHRDTAIDVPVLPTLQLTAFTSVAVRGNVTSPPPLGYTRPQLGKSEKSLFKRYQTQTTLNGMAASEAEIDLNAPESKPYNQGMLNYLRYVFQSFLVKYARILSLYTFLNQTGVRGLVVFDMYTDMVVAWRLYKGNEKVWFMLSSLFIALPFVLVWNVSLRFIQNYVEGLVYKLSTKRCLQFLVNIGLILYMFPPIGSLVVASYEVLWMLLDIYHGIKSFLTGTILVEAEDRQTNAMKTYRKAIEIFAESIPQTFLQTYIYLQLTYVHPELDYGITVQDLYLSLSVSVLNLCVNFYQFRREAKKNGMLFGEYALSVLQLAEVPITKFVPRLPAIKKGYIEEVNYCGFKFDKASVTPLLEAVHSAKCKLQSIKMCIGSLANLDLQSCKILGYLLRNARNGNGINVVLSRVVSLLEVKQIFERFDKSSTGYLNEDEFLTALKELGSPLGYRPIQLQKRVFRELAIRRLTERDRIYFYDFFHQTADLQSTIANAAKHCDFDMTAIRYPLHFMFKRIKQSIERIASSKEKERLDKTTEKQMMANLRKLFHFCEGYDILKEIDEDLNQHVFYSVLDVLHSIDLVPKDKKPLIAMYEKFIWSYFLDLLENPVFDVALFLTRNNLFDIDIIDQKVKLLDAKQFIRKLESEHYEAGYNIFEYCFFYKDERRNKCRAFVYLLTALLQAIERDTNLTLTLDKDMVEQWLYAKTNIKLSVLFLATNGFHVADCNNETPLLYAVKHGHYQAAEFFIKYILSPQKAGKQLEVIPSSIATGFEERKDANTSDVGCKLKLHWIDDQDYLHSILHALFLTKVKSLNKNVDLLRGLLESKRIEINYCCSKSGGYLGHSLVRYRNGDGDDKVFLLKCLQTIYYYGYDFVHNIDAVTGNNILHYAAILGDQQAMEMIINTYNHYDNVEQLQTLLNSKNKHEKMAIDLAMELGKLEIVKLLSDNSEQKMECRAFLEGINDTDIAPTARSLGQKTLHLGDVAHEELVHWIYCLSEIVQASKGRVLNKFDAESKKFLLMRLQGMFEILNEDNEQQPVVEQAPTIFAGVTTLRRKDSAKQSKEHQALETTILYLHKHLGIPLTQSSVNIEPAELN